MSVLSSEDLRQQGLARIRENAIEEALPLFDRALTLTSDSDQIQLIRINKASAMILLERDSPEVHELAAVVLRRANQRHVLLAAYYLAHKLRTEKQHKKALFYLRIALNSAAELNDDAWKAAVLNELGNVSVFDSQLEDAIIYYEQTLELLGNGNDARLGRSFAMQNLGYCHLLTAETRRGIALIHQALEIMREAGAEGYAAESYIDLCYGYLDIEDLEKARYYGELGLEKSTEVRQVRNAHYLLGEVAHKSGDQDGADYHFDQLARFYPDFPHLKTLLHAIDLRGLVNLKL